jgi:hypothetical protein
VLFLIILTMTNLKELSKTVEELGLDLQAIAEEHDRYRLNSSNEDEAMAWLHSLPIENLSDSLNKEHQLPRTKYSLNDMKHKFLLRKLHEKKKEELELLQLELNIAKIDCLIKRIKDIGDDEVIDRA